MAIALGRIDRHADVGAPRRALLQEGNAHRREVARHALAQLRAVGAHERHAGAGRMKSVFEKNLPFCH